MKIAYISGPITAPTISKHYDNLQSGREAAIRYWKLGYAVICPHMNTAFMDGIFGENYDDNWIGFLQGDMEFIRVADVVIMLPGWQESRGAKKEHEKAMKLSKEIIYEEKNGMIYGEPDCDDVPGIAISGKARSGKDTLCSMLLERLDSPWHREAIADQVKIEWVGVNQAAVYAMHGPTAALEWANDHKSEIRDGLIERGVFRREQDPEYWLNKLPLRSGAIITDVRFRNEYDYFRDMGFIMVRVDASEATRIERGGDTSGHAIETELDGPINWDYVVENDSTADALEHNASLIADFIGRA